MADMGIGQGLDPRDLLAGLMQPQGPPQSEAPVEPQDTAEFDAEPKSKWDTKGVMASAIAKDLIERYDTLVNERSAKEEVWREIDQAINCKFPDDSDIKEFVSQRFQPEIFESYNRVRARLKSTVMPHEAWIAAEGRNEKAQQTEGPRSVYMRDRLHACRFDDEFAGPYLSQLVRYGVSPYMVEWKSAPSQRGKREYQWLSGTDPHSYTFSPDSFDGQVFRSINVYTYVCESKAPDMNSALKGYRSTISKSDFDEFVSNGVYKAIPKGTEGETVATAIGEQNRDSKLTDQGLNRTEENRKASDEVELHWFHGTRTIEGQAFVDWIWVVANGSHLVRCERNWYDHGQAPLRHDNLFPDQDDPYGKGLVENVLGAQDTLNISANQWIDGLNLILNPMYLSLEGAIEDAQLVSKPGGVVDVDSDVDDIRKVIQPIHPDTTVLAAVTEMSEQRAVIKDAMFDIKDSQSTTGTQTATEIAASSQERGAVLQLISSGIESNMVRIVEMFDLLEKQFYDPRQAPPQVRAEDRGQIVFHEITPEVVYADYNWRALGSEYTQLRDLRISHLLQIGQVMLGDPELRAGCDVDEFGRALIREIGRTDWAKLFPGAEAMEQRRMAAQMQSAQAAQGAGPGGMGSGSNSGGVPGMGPLGRGAVPNIGGGQNTVEAGERAGMGTNGLI